MPLQQRYYEILVERVRNDRYPSHQLLDRLEATMWTPEQIIGYVDLLLDKIDESWYPSHQLLDRVDRVMHRVAIAA
jgi:ribosome assembly protein YihI (activator of Der GTPase)